MAPPGALVRLSPLHTVDLAEAYVHLLRRPPPKDFPLHTIALKKTPQGRPLVHSELVVAGRATREQFPLAAEFPVHFLKSYHPWSFHGDPGVEFERTRVAATILGAPPPIGYGSNSFRACFIPGKPLSRWSPFTGVEPHERCVQLARETPLPALAGFWRLLEEVHGLVARLHVHGLSHGDLELHNVIVCPAPLAVYLIDFEGASTRETFLGSPAQWEERLRRDLTEILRSAAYVQAALGRQRGALAEAVAAALPRLFRHPEAFLPAGAHRTDAF